MNHAHTIQVDIFQMCDTNHYGSYEATVAMRVPTSKICCNYNTLHCDRVRRYSHKGRAECNATPHPRNWRVPVEGGF
jgi:hypothetical protein